MPVTADDANCAFIRLIDFARAEPMASGVTNASRPVAG
jgi:hypothetical protein